MLLDSIWDSGAWQNWAIWAGVLSGTYLLVMWVAALYWTYRDAVARSRDPMLHGIALATVIVFNLPGLLLYLILRPKTTLTERYEHQLEAEALLHEIQEQPSCPQCRRKIEPEFLACPFCRASLRTACEQCAKALAFGWVVCPYCGAERQQSVPAPAPQRPRASAADASPPDTNVTPMTKPARRASTATYTPPAPSSPADAPAPAIEAAVADTTPLGNPSP
jgi:hypothetical protein